MPTKCSFWLQMEFPLYIWKVRRFHARVPGTMAKGGLMLWQRGLSLPRGFPNPTGPHGPAAMPKSSRQGEENTTPVAENRRASLEHGWGHQHACPPSRAWGRAGPGLPALHGWGLHSCCTLCLRPGTLPYKGGCHMRMPRPRFGQAAPSAPNTAWKGTVPAQLSTNVAAGIEKYF